MNNIFIQHALHDYEKILHNSQILKPGIQEEYQTVMMKSLN